MNEKQIKEFLDLNLGYPANHSYSYSEVVHTLDTYLNNVGNPYDNQTFRANTKNLERDVIRFFIDIWGFSPSSTWGYITGSGSEGNLQGIANAKTQANGKQSLFLYSVDAHYSVPKIARLLSLNSMHIRSQPNGEIDYSDFDKVISANKDKFIIVCATIGTTVKGGIDNITQLHQILDLHGAQHYIHADAALTGFYYPFIRKDLSFKKYISSISISCHKFLGTPFPSGVFLTYKPTTEEIDYIGTGDATLFGSRSGHAAVFINHIIKKTGVNGFAKDIRNCFEVADYAVNSIHKSWRNEESLTVVLPSPSKHIVEKYQLASTKGVSHIVVLPHVTKYKINAFVNDLRLKI